MFKQYTQIIHDFFVNGADPRTINWSLMSSAAFTTSICIYLIIIKVLLPKFMKNREAYNLTTVLLVYNAFQVIFSSYLFYLAVETWFFIIRGSLFKCNSVDYSTSPGSIKVASSYYIYFLSKYTEFFDTFFFILRKKYSQVSFLHVYHHVTTPVFLWIILRYYPGGTFVLGFLLNTLVHIVMYTYYLLAGLGPHMQPYLWWKKYITAIQLIQFTIGTFHLIVSILDSNCNIPRIILLLYAANGLILFIMFSNFYKGQYRKTPSRNESIPQIARSDSEQLSYDKKKSIYQNMAGSSETNNKLKKRILL